MKGSMKLVALVCVLAACMAGQAAAFVVGGVSEGSLEDEAHRTAASIAVQKLNANPEQENGLGLAGPLTLESLKSVSTQVVAGTLYHMRVGVKDATGKVVDLAIKVWSKPWLERSNDANMAAQAWQLTEAKLA